MTMAVAVSLEFMGNGSSYTPPAGTCLSVLLVELAIITILQHAMQLQV